MISRPVQARRLSRDESMFRCDLVRRGRLDSVRVGRGSVIMASTSGTTAPAVARLVALDEDTVRDVIHAFNQQG